MFKKSWRLAVMAVLGWSSLGFAHAPMGKPKLALNIDDAIRFGAQTCEEFFLLRVQPEGPLLKKQQKLTARLTLPQNLISFAGKSLNNKYVESLLGEIDLIPWAEALHRERAGISGAYKEYLDQQTARLAARLEPVGGNPALARNALNFFFRDLLYHRYFAEAFALKERDQKFLEVPLKVSLLQWLTEAWNEVKKDPALANELAFQVHLKQVVRLNKFDLPTLENYQKVASELARLKHWRASLMAHLDIIHPYFHFSNQGLAQDDLKVHQIRLAFNPRTFTGFHDSTMGQDQRLSQFLAQLDLFAFAYALKTETYESGPGGKGYFKSIKDQVLQTRGLSSLNEGPLIMCLNRFFQSVFQDQHIFKALGLRQSHQRQLHMVMDRSSTPGLRSDWSQVRTAQEERLPLLTALVNFIEEDTELLQTVARKLLERKRAHFLTRDDLYFLYQK